MSDLDTYSFLELEELAARIRAEVEHRERLTETKPLPRRRVKPAIMPQVCVPQEGGPAHLAPMPQTIAPEAAPPSPVPPLTAIAEAEKLASPSVLPAEPAPLHIRYMHPSNRQLTWSGEGDLPAWVEMWLFTGGTLYALEVAAEKLGPKPKPIFAPPPPREAQLPSKQRRSRRGPGKPAGSDPRAG